MKRHLMKQMKYEILMVLSNTYRTGDFLSVDSIIKMHGSSAYKVKSHSHPFWKVLSCMMDPADELYTPGLSRVKLGGLYRYRMESTDFGKGFTSK